MGVGLREVKTIDPNNIRPINVSPFNRLNAYLVPSSSEEVYYLSIPYTFCSCPDYISRCLLRHEKRYCYHLENLHRFLEEGVEIKGKPIKTIKSLRALLNWA